MISASLSWYFPIPGRWDPGGRGLSVWWLSCVLCHLTSPSCHTQTQSSARTTISGLYWSHLSQSVFIKPGPGRRSWIIVHWREECGLVNIFSARLTNENPDNYRPKMSSFGTIRWQSNNFLWLSDNRLVD